MHLRALARHFKSSKTLGRFTGQIQICHVWELPPQFFHGIFRIFTNFQELSTFLTSEEMHRLWRFAEPFLR